MNHLRRLGQISIVASSVMVLCLGVVLMAAPAPARAAASDFGLEAVGAEVTGPRSPSTPAEVPSRAGAHPDVTTYFKLKTDPNSREISGNFEPYASPRDITIALPAGMTGDPQNVVACSSEAFSNAIEREASGGVGCPLGAQVGMTELHVYGLGVTLNEPVYDLEAPGGEYVARLGFYAYGIPVFVNVRTRSESDYGLTAEISQISTTFRVVSAKTTLWGVPASPVHDDERPTPLEEIREQGGAVPPRRSAGLAPAPFMTNATSCAPSQEVEFSASSYAEPERVSSLSAPLAANAGCESVPFEPTASLTPTTKAAASPSGLDVDLAEAQTGLQVPTILAGAHLRKAVVTLPRGMTLNPSAAAGLGGCSEAQIGLISTAPPRFGDAPEQCPESSQVGTAEIVTPLLPDPLKGALYVARQDENPFGTLVAGYLVATGKGITIKLAGRFDLDPATGQIKATFDENPQQPFSDLQLHFKRGARGVLTTPSACGHYEIGYELTPWSGTAPVVGSSGFDLSEGCATGGFAPRLEAGTLSPAAGQYSQFVLDLSRSDGEQNLSAVDLTLADGVLAKLAGVALCPDSSAGTGACPAGSRVGSVSAAVGSGTQPLQVPEAGKAPTAAYLAGPYKGAPYSLVFVVPAQAGPFDLGTVVTRAAIYVDPETTQVTVRSDPLPQILQGVPISYRRLDVDLDRPDFTVNPTDCEPGTIASSIASSGGATATPSSRFEAIGCAGLAFRPSLMLSLKGSTRRAGHPALKAVVTYPKGGPFANIAAARVSLPHSEFLDQGSIGTVCTQPQLRSKSCPEGSVYGRVKAYTPLLEKPLEGPVYLGAGYGHKLPDLVADLDGQIRVLLHGKVDTDAQKGLRTTFETVPDAAVSRFVLELRGGPKKGLLENSENLCEAAQKAAVRFTAQSGRVETLQPRITDGCGHRKGKD